MNLGPHGDFIVAAYAVTLFVVALLVAWVVLDYSAQQRVLGDLEARGITRRSRRQGDTWAKPCPTIRTPNRAS
ncbi:MAG TPA: heme exporter protein CcmD, partial [Pseudolabrys sp.]